MSDTVVLTFKDLKNEKFTLDANRSDIVATVKDKIQEAKGWDASSIKLIYSGKILQDSQTIGSYNIEEKGFVVCMVSKPKATASKASGSSSAAAPSTPVKSSTPVQQPPPAPVANPQSASSSATPAVPETPTPAPQAAATHATPAAFGDPSSLAMGTARESAIQQMTEMGFPRPDVEAAMRAAFNNPDRAVEYLMTGIPDNLQRDAPPAQSSRPPAQQGAAPPTTQVAPPAQTETTEVDEPINLFDAAAAQRQGSRGTPVGRGAGGAAAAAALGAGAAGGPNLDFLRNNPQFQQLRQVVQQNPQMLEPILQQVGSGNPQLAQLIGQNPEQFLRLLSEGIETEEELGGIGQPPAGIQIQVTEEERDAIGRLCALGFERDIVIQAYFACDKNEELAANLLFETSMEDEQLP